MKRLLLLLTLSIFTFSFSYAQLSVPTSATPVTVDFNGFDGSGFANPPAAGQLSSLEWDFTGFSDAYSYSGTNASGDYARGASTTGMVSSGGVYGLHVFGDTILGIQPTGGDFTPGTITLVLTNNTGMTMTELHLSYWVGVINDQGRSNSMNFSYSIGGVTYTPVSALDYTSPLTAFAPPIDSAIMSTTVTGLTIPDLSTFYLRWTGSDAGGGGSRDEFGLDDISVMLTDTGAAPVIEPDIEFDVTTSSANENVGIATATVNIINPDTDTTWVDVEALTSSTATAGTDFTGFPVTLMFLPSDTTPQTVNIPIVNDAIAESNETVVLRLRNATSGANLLADSTHTFTILDDDIVYVKFDTTASSFVENAGAVTVDVAITNTSTTAISADVSLDMSSSATGTDFTYTSPTTVTFPASSTVNQTVTVTLLDDAIFELGEDVVLKIDNVTGGAAVHADSIHTLTIMDDDTFTAATGPCANLFFSEYIEGTGFNKALEIYNPTATSVDLSFYTIMKVINGSSVSYRQLNGTLAAGDVYILGHPSAADTNILTKADTLTGFISHNGDDGYALINVTDTIDAIGQLHMDPGTSWMVGSGSTRDNTLVRNQYIYEGTTNWAVGATQWDIHPNNFSDSLDTHFIQPCGTLPPVSIDFANMTATMGEGGIKIGVEVTVSSTAFGPVSVDVVDAMSGSATSGSDYTHTTSTLSYAMGSATSQWDTIFITEDIIIEGSETVDLMLMNPVGGTTGVDSFTLTIMDNDALQVEFLGAGQSVSEAAGSTLMHVTINALSSNATSVDVNYMSGDATLGTDFTYTDTTITFPAMDTNRIALWVGITEDTIDEVNEQAIIDLSNPTNGATLGTTAHTITIIDNDTTIIITPGFNDAELLNSTKVYPNPTADVLVVNSSELLDVIIIHNAMGQEVTRIESISNEQTKVNVAELSNGVYTITVKQGDKLAVRKFIKE